MKKKKKKRPDLAGLYVVGLPTLAFLFCSQAVICHPTMQGVLCMPLFIHLFK